MLVQRDCSVEDDWREKDVEEEVGGEQGERVDHVHPGDEEPNEPAQDDEHAGLRQQLLQPGGVMEEDLEDKGSDDERADHHLTLETACGRIVDGIPPPSVEVDTLPVVARLHVTSIFILPRIVWRDTGLMFLHIVYLILHINRV